MKSKPPIEFALELGGAGFAVFPVGRNKAPRCPRGHLAASTDPDQIRAMVVRFGFILIGVATGEASNASVLDLDHQHGAGAWWQENRHRIPATRVHQTRSGGLHLWFRHHPGLRCSTARIAPGVDVKASGGACIWWPTAGLKVLADAPLAPWPEWLTSPFKTASPPSALPVFTGKNAARRYAEAAMRRAIREVATAALDHCEVAATITSALRARSAAR